MARVVATGARGPSRAARAGSALGGGAASAFIPAFQEARAAQDLADRFDPIREVLAEQLQGQLGQMNPAQQMLSAATGDRNAFAQLMSDPQSLAGMSTVANMATPAAPAEFTLGPNETRFRGTTPIAQGVQDEESDFPELDQITAALDRADAFREAGDERRAEIFEARAADMAGVERPQMSSTAQAIRDMGLNPAEGEGRELMRQSIIGRQQRSSNAEKVDVLTSRGIDQQLAEDIVYGFAEREYIPELGVWRVTNPVTGEVTELNPAQTSALQSLGEPAQPVAQAGPTRGNTLWDLAEVATGPSATVRAGAENVLALMPGVEREGIATEARQAFNTETRNMIRALSLNPRFPVAEQQRIQQEIGRFMPAMWRGEQTVKDRMRSINRSLSSDINRYVELAQTPGAGLSDEERAGYMKAANDISLFLDNLGVPDEPPAEPGEQGGGQSGAQQQPGAATAPGDVPSDQSAPGAELPEGIPQGSQYVGDNRMGSPMYRTPDGRTLVVEQ